MADFIAFIPREPRGPSDPGPDRGAAYLRSILKPSQVQRRRLGAVEVLWVQREGDEDCVVESGSGFLVLKGTVFIPGVEQRGRLDGARKALAAFEAEGFSGLDAFEGAFGLFVWDGRRGVGCAAVDQAATINTYVQRGAEGVIVTTLPLAAAVARGLDFDPEGVRQFLARGLVTAPLSLFEGLERLDFGTRAVVDHEGARTRRWWEPFRSVEPLGFEAAAERLASVARDRVRAFVADGRPVFDLTSGYDSRLVVAAASAAGIEISLTVNGDHDSIETRIPRMAAERFGWDLTHFVQREEWTRPVTEEWLREMLLRTGGELPLTAVYHHLLTRPQLAARFDIHLHGASVGSDLARYYAWSHEFAAIGRRRRANVERLLRFRFLQFGRPPGDLFVEPFYDTFIDELRTRIDGVLDLGEGRRNTDQLDAIHIWKNTSFISAYTSALFGLLPTYPPINAAGFIEAAMSTPLRHKLTTNLVRRVITVLDADLAALPTRYGNTAEPVGPRTAFRELAQVARRSGHLLWKLDRVALGGRITRKWKTLKTPSALTRPLEVPFEGSLLEDTLNFDSMRTRGLFRRKGLARLVAASQASSDASMRSRILLYRLLTLEQAARDVDRSPSADLLMSMRSGN